MYLLLVRYKLTTSDFVVVYNIVLPCTLLLT